MPAPKTPDDRALLAACARGDGDAWDAIIERYRRLVYSIPHGYRLDPEAADEIFQRVSLRLVENVANIRDPDRLGAWLAVTTRRECWAFSRERSRSNAFEDGEEEAIPDDEPIDVLETLHAIECQHALALAFEQLGDPCHSLLAAMYVEEPTPSYDELSERFGRPIGSLGPTRGRCLRKLRRLYDKQGGPPPTDSNEVPTYHAAALPLHQISDRPHAD